MKLASNGLQDVKKYFRDKLSEIYGDEELALITRYVLEFVLKCNKTALDAGMHERITESDLVTIIKIVKRLSRHEPIQYVLGEADFYGMKFLVNPSVLIPRPETEELVQEVIKAVKNSGSSAKILDIGTGSACIPVCIKQQLPLCEVFAMDVSEAALEVAKENARRNKTSIHFFSANILEQVDNSYPFQQLDVVVSNPPYITKAEAKEMEKRVLNFEPHLALFVEKEDPLQFYKHITDFSITYLKKGGLLFFELNATYANQVVELLNNEGFRAVELINDLSGKPRILKGIKKG